MLRSLEALRGYSLEARDGIIGWVKDIYFDDWVWTVRYLVADTERWLPGRLILLSPATCGQPNWQHKTIPVDLSKREIDQSPSIEEHERISREIEEKIVLYYKWPQYWPDPEFTYTPPDLRLETTPGTGLTSKSTEAQVQVDPHLRSEKEVRKFRIHAKDGDIGHLADFIADDEVWALRYAVIDTGHWLPGKQILLATEWIREINVGKAFVPLSKSQIQNSPPFNPAEPVNRDYESRLYDYYGRPRYWEPEKSHE